MHAGLGLDGVHMAQWLAQQAVVDSVASSNTLTLPIICSITKYETARAEHAITL